MSASAGTCCLIGTLTCPSVWSNDHETSTPDPACVPINELRMTSTSNKQIAWIFG